ARKRRALTDLSRESNFRRQRRKRHGNAAQIRRLARRHDEARRAIQRPRRLRRRASRQQGSALRADTVCGHCIMSSAFNRPMTTDRGYFNSEEILACEEAGITVTLPKPMTSNAKAEGRFGKQDFRYVADEDVYRRSRRASRAILSSSRCTASIICSCSHRE